MGRIEISDGISARTIPTDAFPHAIRIEAPSSDDVRLIVPEDVAVSRTSPVADGGGADDAGRRIASARWRSGP